MKNMQASLFLNIPHRLLRRVGRCLVHDYHQMPFLMMLQHLPEECDHFLRTDSFLMQFENEPSRSIDGGNRRNPSPLARYLLARRQSTRSPGLSQESSQRNIGFVLKIQQSPVFLHGFADFRSFRRHPFLTGFLVHFKILPFRLLVGQTGIPQSSPDGVMRNRGSYSSCTTRCKRPIVHKSVSYPKAVAGLRTIFQRASLSRHSSKRGRPLTSFRSSPDKPFSPYRLTHRKSVVRLIP